MLRSTNVYLHYVFDLWVHRWRLTKASGDMIVTRYADDTTPTPDMGPLPVMKRR